MSPEGEGDGPSSGRRVLTLTEEGWTYQRVVELLFDPHVELPPLGIIYTSDIEEAERAGASHITYVCRATVRGKGRTDGYHERAIPIPLSIARDLSYDTYRDYQAHRAVRLMSDEEREKLAALVETEMLRRRPDDP